MNQWLIFPFKQNIMTSSISLLRTAIISKKAIKLIPEGATISDAKELAIEGQPPLSLDEQTGFVNQEDNVNEALRAVYQCWIHHEASTTDYLADCEKNSIAVINFLERTELNSYLSGSSDTCKYLATSDGNKKLEAAETTTSTENRTNGKKSTSKRGETSESSLGEMHKRQKIIDSDPFLKSVLENEREIVDHNSALRGSKPVKFANLAKECEYKIVRPLKRETGSSRDSGSKAHRHHHQEHVDPHSLSVVLKHKDPIIILSPSASALINLGNVKDFLENGKFVDTSIEATQGSAGSQNVVEIVRNSKKFNRKIKFLVVSDVDRFFTKPEHWDRVVAVFTTGQEWQFKNYRYSRPNILFQKVKGFYVHYNEDLIPPSIKGWNLEVIPIERSRRFRDKQTTEHLWEILEKFMATKGYK